MNEIIAELTLYLETVQQFDKDSAQDSTALHAYMIELTQMMSRSNFLMAEYGKKFRDAKKLAYEKLAASQWARQKYYAISLAKDYVDAQCSEIGYVYELAERTSRTCVHVLEGVRTIVSSLKSERTFSQYQT